MLLATKNATRTECKLSKLWNQSARNGTIAVIISLSQHITSSTCIWAFVCCSVVVCMLNICADTGAANEDNLSTSYKSYQVHSAERAAFLVWIFCW